MILNNHEYLALIIADIYISRSRRSEYRQSFDNGRKSVPRRGKEGRKLVDSLQGRTHFAGGKSFEWEMIGCMHGWWRWGRSRVRTLDLLSRYNWNFRRLASECERCHSSQIIRSSFILHRHLSIAFKLVGIWSYVPVRMSILKSLSQEWKINGISLIFINFIGTVAWIGNGRGGNAKHSIQR